MSGMVPPWPMVPQAAPKCACEADCSACSNHGVVSGAFQPLAAPSGLKVTLA